MRAQSAVRVAGPSRHVTQCCMKSPPRADTAQCARRRMCVRGRSRALSATGRGREYERSES
eukprot:4031731-Alexandrium_andersonii.AAC.1